MTPIIVHVMVAAMLYHLHLLEMTTSVNRAILIKAMQKFYICLTHCGMVKDAVLLKVLVLAVQLLVSRGFTGTTATPRLLTT